MKRAVSGEYSRWEVSKHRYSWVDLREGRGGSGEKRPFPAAFPTTVEEGQNSASSPSVRLCGGPFVGFSPQSRAS